MIVIRKWPLLVDGLYNGMSIIGMCCYIKRCVRFWKLPALSGVRNLKSRVIGICPLKAVSMYS